MSRVSCSLCHGRRLGRLAAGIAAARRLFFSAALTVLAGTGAAATGSTYVAMGDSYTSGPVIPTQSSAAGGCDRSNENYPSDVAAALKLTLTDVSCSGATTANILNTTQDGFSRSRQPAPADRLGSGYSACQLADRR